MVCIVSRVTSIVKASDGLTADADHQPGKVEDRCKERCRIAQCATYDPQAGCMGLCLSVPDSQCHSHSVVMQVIGVKGPLPPQNDIEQTIAMEINPPHDLGWHHQSVAFIVL